MWVCSLEASYRAAGLYATSLFCRNSHVYEPSVHSCCAWITVLHKCKGGKDPLRICLVFLQLTNNCSVILKRPERVIICFPSHIPAAPHIVISIWKWLWACGWECGVLTGCQWHQPHASNPCDQRHQLVDLRRNSISCSQPWRYLWASQVPAAVEFCCQLEVPFGPALLYCSI